MRACRLYCAEHLFVNLFRYIVTGKTAAVSDSRLLIDHLILFYTAFFLSAANGCYGYCTAADKQQSNPQQKIGVISSLRRLFGAGFDGADKSPQTGDNSNLLLWIALLFVSGGAVTVTTVCGRKKKRSVK